VPARALDQPVFRPARNFEKHGVRFADAVLVLDDPYALTVADHESDPREGALLGTVPNRSSILVLASIRDAVWKEMGDRPGRNHADIRIFRRDRTLDGSSKNRASQFTFACFASPSRPSSKHAQG
jgi:hypothetical protein